MVGAAGVWSPVTSEHDGRGGEMNGGLLLLRFDRDREMIIRFRTEMVSQNNRSDA